MPLSFKLLIWAVDNESAHVSTRACFASRGAGMPFAFQPMFRRRSNLRSFIAAMLAGMVLVGAPGCGLILPDVSHEPVVHNPFPQLNKVAVAPFFNLSNEPTVVGRKFALAYFA